MWMKNILRLIAALSFCDALLSRPAFVGRLLLVPTTTISPWVNGEISPLLASTPSKQQQRKNVSSTEQSPLDNNDDIVIPLRWLPIAGCLATTVLFVDESSFRYTVVVDTGSPFLTAPPDCLLFFKSSSSLRAEARYPPTTEQYGESAATITWRKARHVMVGGGMISCKPCRLGIIPNQLVQDTGGLFCGLIWQDDARPTFLQQIQRHVFTVDYPACSLTLHKTSPIANDSEYVLDMFDLSPFGPDLYHYALLATEVNLQTDQGILPILNATTPCTRPIVVVIDTGLTGCIFSDSLVNDGCLPVPVSSIRGAQIKVGSMGKKQSSTRNIVVVCLQSDDTYWNLACFRLPWFTNEDAHPHIVAVGATFLRKSRLTIDAKQKRIRLLSNTRA